MKIKIPQFWSLFNMTACILLIGWCAYGPEKEVYKSRDGSGANGEKPVQGETNGATGSCQVDRNDPCLTGTSRGIQQSSKTEKRIHMELVSLHDEVSPFDSLSVTNINPTFWQIYSPYSTLRRKG